MEKFIARAKELFRMSDNQLARIYCYHIDSADIPKFEWRIFQGRKDYIRDILTYELGG